MNKGVTDELDWQKTIYQNQGKNNLKEELTNILQEKLNNIHIEFAGNEWDFCKVSGFAEGIKFAIEEIKKK